MTKKTNFILLASDYLNLLGYSIFFPFFALFAVSLGASPEMTGYIWAFNTVIAGVVMLTYGLMSLRFKHEKVIVIMSLLALAITSLLFLQVRSVKQLFFVIIVNAVASGFYLPAWKSVYTQSIKKNNSTRDWSFFDGGNMLVTAAGVAVGGILIGRYGFHGALLGMFFLQALGALVAIRLLSLKSRR